ncbi:MAG: endonuclease/exonuclease/phosphatase family protein [Fimbriimonadaceae bacterium]|nr:endonuclease/exonuclease/phosphatase family protein [Fimbriimonadaceae bacterium]
MRDETTARQGAPLRPARKRAEPRRRPLPWLSIIVWSGALLWLIALRAHGSAASAWAVTLFSPALLTLPLAACVTALVFRRFGLATLNLAAVPALALLMGWYRLPAAGAQGSEAALRVMTYNILSCRMGDCRDVAAEIRRSSPDVVLLQEAGGPEIQRRLTEALPEYRFLGHNLRLVLTRLPVREYSVEILAPRDYHGYTQAVLETRGGPVRFVSLHQPSYRLKDVWLKSPGSVLKQPVRVARHQMKLIRELTRRFPGNDSVPTVIGGDFNSPPAGPQYQAMKERYQDAFRTAGSGWEATYPSQSPILALDRIWVDRRWRVLSAKIPDSRASDHRPVVADLAPRDFGRTGRPER